VVRLLIILFLFLFLFLAKVTEVIADNKILEFLLNNISLLKDEIMAININNLNESNQVKQTQNQVKQQSAQTASTNTQTKSSAQDSVSITPQAKQLNELQKKAADAPVINQKKIDELKKAISSGDYQVNSEKLAASIANFEFKLI
jgi:negative regulator of flagellin synthesis FlgM